MHDRHLSNVEIFVAEVTGGSFVAHVLSAVTHAPSWVTGGLSAVIIGCALRILDPTLRAIGLHVRRKVLPPSIPPVANDDHDGPDDADAA